MERVDISETLVRMYDTAMPISNWQDFFFFYFKVQFEVHKTGCHIKKCGTYLGNTDVYFMQNLFIISEFIKSL